MTRKKPIKVILNPLKDRSVIQRRHAADYLLITLLSFAFSVAGTRLFLELTGYPKIGVGEIHIAHVLWGGIFLFAAALLPVIFLNEWIYALSAMLSGFGVGLFIDEVGKFITQNNDYFYPSAAPIIYVFFLLTVLVFSQVRLKERVSTRSKMYGVIERFSEVLDRDLSLDESKELTIKLDDVIKSSQEPELVNLAETLKSYLASGRSRIAPHAPTFLDKIRSFISRFETNWLTRNRMRSIIIIGLFAWGIWALISPLGYLSLTKNPQQLQVFIDQLMTDRLVRNASGLNWFEARVLLEGSMGVLSIISGVIFLFKLERPAIWVGIADLLVTLTIVNLLVFYFDQFSTMVAASFQFVLFTFLLRYQRRFIKLKQIT